MAETCIVCLGDLAGGGADVSSTSFPSPTNDSLEADADHTASKLKQIASPQHEILTDEEEIAHLLPCGHNLHHDCLKPWVERANSCPICRASFNMVELSARIGGLITSSYAVQDKQQVADIDPSMVIEEEDVLEDDGYEPCMVCEDFGDITSLMQCNGCEQLCHVFCAGLDVMPARGPWYCQTCLENPQILGEASRGPQPRNPQAFTNGRGRRRNAARQPNAWARVWQTVYDRLHLDLDFPFDEEASEPDRTSEAQRREFEEWERRLQVATRNGAGDRFRRAAASVLEPNNNRSAPQPPPDPESQEELRAWNAFEKAREQLEDGSSSSNRRKRKSVTSSPAESDARREPERKLKRPRTRIAHEVGEASRDPIREPVAETSIVARAPEPRNSSPLNGLRDGGDSNGAIPGFLQSLLKEVEVTPDTEDEITAPQPKRVIIERACSPQGSSPGLSPVYPSPRGMTPPPLNLSRPISPQLQASPNLSPGYSPGSRFPPYSPAEDDLRPGRRRHGHQNSPGALSSPPRSKDSSPNRPNLSYSTKAEIQRMVSAALKPRYLKHEVSKDEYTDINRDVSRRLYDRVGDKGPAALADQSTREMWQKVAGDEVEGAVRALRAAEGGEVVETASVEGEAES